MKIINPAIFNAFSAFKLRFFPEFPPEVQLNDLRKRKFFEHFVCIVNFVLPAFGVYNLIRKDIKLAVFDFAVWVIMLTGIVVLRRIQDGMWIFRCIVLSLYGLFFWNAIQSDPHGSGLFWFLLSPFTIFLLGGIEGALWGAFGGIMLALVLHQAVPGLTVYDYPYSVRLKFFSVYYILILVAMVYEHSRNTIENINKAEHLQLQNKQRNLISTQRALKKVIRRLNHSRAHLNRAQAMARVGSWEYDMETGEVGLSHETRRIYGMSHSQGVVPIEYFKPQVKDSRRILAGMENLVHFGHPFDMELLAWRFSDEMEIILHAKAELVRDEIGQPVKIFGVVQDITERKKSEKEKERLEVQLQQARKMEAIGTLAGGVAHDLNNILAGVLSYPELILLQMPLDHPLRKPIDTIRKSGEKAAAIVEDLLTLARRNVAIHESLNLNQVIDDYLSSPEFERLKAHHPGLRIETNLEKSLKNISGSPIHLAKTVMNLVSNAAESMPDGGKITIATKNCPGCPALEKAYGNKNPVSCVHLLIKDQGMGIDPEDKKKIFEPFFTKKTLGRSGTGLGMAVVWGSVQDHRGYIDINSTPGCGTIFTIHFPGNDGSGVSRYGTQSCPDLPKGCGETILIVDDIEEQRLIASAMLAELGYHTVEVESGEEAVNFLKEKKADLVLLDMIMDPGISGLETYREIITIHPGQPAVIVSGFSKNGQVKHAIELGANVYLKKPYTMEEIASAVHFSIRKSDVGISSE